MLGAALMMAAGGATPSTLLTGLCGYWRLDGDGTDALGVSNGTLQGSGSSWNTGKIGQALYLGGAGRLNVGNNSVLKPRDALTVGGWFWFNGPQPDNLRACSDWHQSALVDRWILGYANNGTTIYGVIAPSTFVLFGAIGSTISANTWVRLDMTWDRNGSGAVLVYRNGVQVGSVTGVTAQIAGGSGNVCLGQQEEVGSGLDGRIDEFGIWSRALTGTEIAEIYNGGAGKAYPF